MDFWSAAVNAGWSDMAGKDEIDGNSMIAQPTQLDESSERQNTIEDRASSGLGPRESSRGWSVAGLISWNSLALD